MSSTTTPRITPLVVLLIIMVLSTILVPIIAMMYSYNVMSIAVFGAGFLILLATSIILLIYRQRSGQQGTWALVNRAILVGLAIGLLWVIEININNIIAPPLPARDIIDNIFWGVIAFLILIFTVISAYQTDSVKAGIVGGAWSGLASGALACCMALSLIIFGMGLITHDPLNVAEWAARGAGDNAPTMMAYFAHETFAGALMHLIVLGVVMGGLLGILGGAIGKGVKRVGRLLGS